MRNISNDNNPSELNIEELKNLEKKSRHIIYIKYKEPLENVLRFNSMGVIVPEYIEKSLRSILKKIRDDKTIIDDIEIYDDENKVMLRGEKQKKGRVFFVNGKKYFSIATSGDTYRHTGIQGIEVYKGGKESLKSGDIDEYQYLNDIIRDEWHDVPEYITDDIPRFEKSDKYRQWEKETEHNIILNENTSSGKWGKLTDKEKSHLIKILNYTDDSRFKIYEHLLFIKDAIEMKNNADKYNETLSVIYEILKRNMGKINKGKIKLDNGKSKDILSFKGIRKFINDHINDIDLLFEYLKNNTDKLENEFRFTQNGYDINELKEGYNAFIKNWKEIKIKLSK